PRLRVRLPTADLDRPVVPRAPARGPRQEPLPRRGCEGGVDALGHRLESSTAAPSAQPLRGAPSGTACLVPVSGSHMLRARDHRSNPSYPCRDPSRAAESPGSTTPQQPPSGRPAEGRVLTPGVDGAIMATTSRGLR